MDRYKVQKTTTNDDVSFAWRAGFKLSLSVAMGYLPAGIAFGVLAHTGGLPTWYVLLLSLLIYAGAAQYACLPMLSTGLPIGQLGLNIGAINLRHVFYASPLLDALPKTRWQCVYCLFALTDETFSIVSSRPPSSRSSLVFPVSIFNHGWWVLATVLGIWVGDVLNRFVPHLDFALLCLFVILAYEQFVRVRRVAPIGFALLSFVVLAWSPAAWHLLLAIVLSTLLIVLWGGHHNSDS